MGSILLFIQRRESFFKKLQVSMNPAIIKRVIKLIKNEMYDKSYEQIRETLNLKEDWFEKYIEEVLIKILTKRYDVAMRNLGITTEGYLKYYDSAAECHYKNDITDVQGR
jgi:hypothetical protein